MPSKVEVKEEEDRKSAAKKTSLEEPIKLSIDKEEEGEQRKRPRIKNTSSPASVIELLAKKDQKVQKNCKRESTGEQSKGTIKIKDQDWETKKLQERIRAAKAE